MLAPRRLFPLLVALSVALLAYTSLRAVRLSFVHDESLSFAILEGATGWKSTANDHPLNTLLMGWALRLLGAREWQLRLPNVLSHVLYLGCCLVLLRQLAHGAAALLGFALLNLNPFLLDFFGLARGYGLALALSMAALLLLWLAWRAAGWPARVLLVLSSSACASLADMANYTWLNLHLPLLAAGVLLLLCQPDPMRVRANAAALTAAAVLVAANAWVFAEVARRVWAIKKVGELYGRGTHGFVDDTVGSLVESYFYRQPYGDGVKWALTAAVVAALVVVAVVVGRRAWTDRRISFAALLLLVVGLAVAAPIAEHALLGVEYPNERIALYYIPAAGLLAMFAVDEALGSARPAARLPIQAACLVMVAGMAVHFARTANLRHTRTWFYDANTKAAMLEVAKQFGGPRSGRPVNIGNSWMFEPTINYYRRSRDYTWLGPATRDRLQRDDNDVVYCLRPDVPGSGRYEVAQAYPDTDTVLYVRRY